MLWITESHVSIHLSVPWLTHLTLQARRSGNIMQPFPAFPMFFTQHIKTRLQALSRSHNLCPIILVTQAHWYLCFQVVLVPMLCLRAGVFVLTGSEGDWMILYRLWQATAALKTSCAWCLYFRKLILLSFHNTWHTQSFSLQYCFVSSGYLHS